MTSPYASAAVAQLDRVTTQAELDALSPIITGALNSQISAAAAAQTIMGPINTLSTTSIGSTLATVISFLTSLQSAVLVPQAASLARLVTAGALATTDRAAVRVAIAQAQARIDGIPWIPYDLGASLLGYWDAEVYDTLTLSGASVTKWADLIAGYAPTTALSASWPTYSANSFNGRPGIVFDGIDDFLAVSVSNTFPIGSNGSEIWALVRQDSLPADTTTRNIFYYQGTSNQRRSLNRNVVSGVNRAQGIIGTGAAAAVAAGPTSAAFSGIHVVRLAVGATSSTCSVDGTAGVAASIVPSTVSTMMGISTVAASFKGTMNAILVTAPLTADQATQLRAFLMARGGLA